MIIVPLLRSCVSTLTRREHRVRRVCAVSLAYLQTSFNPHPARTPGATAADAAPLPVVLQVSTLTRREHRVRQRLVAAGGRFVCFNPHPARTPGATSQPTRQR